MLTILVIINKITIIFCHVSLLQKPAPKRARKAFKLIEGEMKSSSKSYQKMSEIAIALQNTEELELAAEAYELAKEYRNKCQELYDKQVAWKLLEEKK